MLQRNISVASCVTKLCDDSKRLRRVEICFVHDTTENASVCENVLIRPCTLKNTILNKFVPKSRRGRHHKTYSKYNLDQQKTYPPSPKTKKDLQENLNC